MNSLRDRFQRTVDYMRISITDRCNLRCMYCMPPDGIPPIKHKEILTYEEIFRILHIAAGSGVRTIRITGGEPLVRRDVSHLIRLIKSIKGILDISLTTNGILLEHHAEQLVDAGLDRVNISLDSLNRERYRKITRGGDITAVFRGIEAAEKAGLVPVKLNMVPIRGFNDDEIKDFARLTLKASYQVRFIEFMPFSAPEIWSPEKFIPADEIRSVAEEIGPLSPVKLRKSGPAQYFRFEGSSGVLGFISPLSNHFCGECNRLRLTADGKLRPCLFSETEIDLKPALRGDAPDSEIERLINLSIEVKPEGHNIRIQNTSLNAIMEKRRDSKRPMSKIGG
jgi:cyclic pyranopterin phosphate synthase